LTIKAIYKAKYLHQQVLLWKSKKLKQKKQAANFTHKLIQKLYWHSKLWKLRRLCV